MIKQLRDIWLVLTGELSSTQVYHLRMALETAQQTAALQLHRANEAVKLYNEAEVGRKEASDALGQKVLKDTLQ